MLGTVRGVDASKHRRDAPPDQCLRPGGRRLPRARLAELCWAAAQAIDLPLITRDAQIRGSGTVKVIW